jgi:hypothetical protein
MNGRMDSDGGAGDFYGTNREDAETRRSRRMRGEKGCYLPPWLLFPGWQMRQQRLLKREFQSGSVDA